MRLIAADHSYDIPYEDATITQKKISHYLNDETGKLLELAVPAYRLTATIDKMDIILATCPSKAESSLTMSEILDAYIKGSPYVKISNDYEDRFHTLYENEIKEYRQKHKEDAKMMFG